MLRQCRWCWETKQRKLVHDVTVFKSDVEKDKEDDRQLASRMVSVKTAPDQLREEVETVRKMALGVFPHSSSPLGSSMCPACPWWLF